MNRKVINCLLLLIGIFLIVTLLWMIYDNKNLQSTEYTVSSSHIPSSFNGFRIVQVSDLHNAEFGHNNETLLQAVKGAKPDIIVITGDIVDSRHTNYQTAIMLCHRLVEIAPTYYVTGNHEAMISNTGKLFGGLISGGVTILSDDAILLSRNTDQIQLAGIADPASRVTNNTSEVLQDLCKTDGMYTILLSHRPELMDLYAECNIDLVLCGHAHGGQFRLPFIGGVFAPNQGFFPIYDAGLFTQNRTTMVVSRGLGNSAFPLRFNNPPEIIILELNCEK